MRKTNMHVYLLTVMLTQICVLNAVEKQITFDGGQHISSSLLASPLHLQSNDLTITFRTHLSSCVLFFASGVTGDYIALELYRGRIRYVSNSNGLKSTSPIEIVYGKNYADGNYHQVNVEIGEMTKLYTYSFPVVESNATIVRSTSSDLRYDLDEFIYYAGIPISKRINAKAILLSQRNFEGCLNVLSFNRREIELTRDYFAKTPSDTFAGAFIAGCISKQPDFLVSFTSPKDNIPVSSHVNDNHFLVEFSYRTYLQNGVLVRSISQRKASSVVLLLRDNELNLNVNLTAQISVNYEQYDKNADDGVWKKIRVEVTSSFVEFRIDNEIKFRHEFNKTTLASFPNEVVFSGEYAKTHGLIGCMKDIQLGKELISINKILRRPKKVYTEKMCIMKDLCFPNRPCQNGGRCIQTLTNHTCDCSSTGYKGSNCEIEDVQNYKKTCSEYYNDGFRQNGIYTVKPGSSRPFKVRCDMRHVSGPMTLIDINNKNQTHVFEGNNYDKDYYYHQVSYQASKRQVSDLVTASVHCRQYVRYNCYESTLLNSKEKLRQATNIGLRWYSSSGLLRSYWTGNRNNERTCKCGLDKSCANEKLLCNCDVMDKTMRFDDGYLTEKKDLPISKIRVSISKTSHPSSFQVGMLQCTDQIQTTTSYPFEKSTKYTISVATQTPAYGLSTDSNDIPSEPPSFTTTSSILHNGVYHKGHNNETELATNEQNKPSGFVLIGSTLFHVIIVAVTILIVIFIFILIFKRRICCCYHQFNAKPQIVELYKEELSRNNNKNILQISNDVTVNVDDTAMPFSRGMSSYQASCSDSSVSTIDPGRYYADDDDPETFSLQSNKSTLSMPKRGILKIKKDSTSSHSRSTKGEESRPSSYYSRSKGDPLSVFSKTYGNSKDNKFNYELDHSDICPAMSPLKQKVLELSTNTNRKILRSELYFRQESNSSNSSSCISNKESEANSDTDNDAFAPAHENIPLTKCQRSKSVRFNDEQSQLIPDRTHRTMQRTFESKDMETLLYCHEPNKTLV